MKAVFFRFLFILGIFSTPQLLWAVAGDDCSTAILISSNGCSGATAYNNTGITGTLAAPSCFTGGNNNGMWFAFVASAPTVNVTVNAGSLTQPQVALLSPATYPCTGTFTELACASAAVAPASLSYSALTTGNTYYLYVDGRNNLTGTFQLCLNSPLQPGNDNPCNRYVVPAANFCSGVNAYTNAGATADNLFSVSFPPCWNSTIAFNTVWFQFTAIGAYNTITVSGTGPSGLVQPQVAIISTGNCNGTAWSSLGASNCGSATVGNNSVTINANNLTPGTTYYVAVDGVAGNTGAFQLCINSFTPSATPLNDLCSGAIPLCPNGYYTGTTLNATNTGDPDITQWSCNAVVDNAVWYTFVTTNPVQPIVFNITAVCNADLLQFEVFDHTGAGTMCSTTTGDVSVGCTTFGPTGNGSLTLPAATLSPGRTYYVLIDNWPGDNCGFNFSISGNAGANAGTDQTVCLNAAAFNLVGTPAGGVWSGPGITNGALGTFSPSAAGLGTVTVFYTNGACVDQKIINVTGPQVVVSAPVSICPGQSTNLQGTITPYPSTTTQTFTNTTDYSIADGTGVLVSSPITVSGISPTTVASNPIVSVCIDIAHTYDSDLDIYLQCPGGTQILLAGPVGGAGDNFTGTCFVTGAPPITGGSAPFTGSYAPQNAFSGLNGCNVNGTWNLRVGDFVGGDVGTVLDWSISFTNTTTIASYAWSPTVNMTNSGTLNPTVTPSATTTYTLTATDGNGCTASDNVTITVLAKPNAGADQNVPCFSTGTATLAGTGVGTWTPMAGNPGTATITNNTSPTTTITAFSATGTYNFIWTNASGCTDTVAVIAGNTCGCANPPTIALNATANTICAGLTKTITGTFGGSATQVTASSSGTGSFVTTTANASPFSFTYTPSVADIAAGTVTLTFTTNNPLGAPCVAATTTFTLTINALPTVAPTATPTAICNGGSTTLAANATAGSGAITTYAWSSGIVGNLSGGSVSPTTNTTYTVTVTNSNTCTATGTISVTVNALPTVAPTATPAAICNGGSTTLAANAVAGSGAISTYAWSSGIVGNLSGGSVSPTTNTTYTVTVTNSNTCTATGTISVTVNALPTVAPTATPTAICNGGSTTLAANAVAGSGVISTYAWSSGIVGNLSGGSVSPTTNTTYTVTVTNSNTCTATGTISVTVNALPTVAPTATPAAICNGGSTTLAANAVAGSGVISTYAWSSGIVGNLSGGSVSPTTNTTYTVTVTNSNTCTATASVAVTVNALPTVAPTATPAAICNGGSTTLAANAVAGSGAISTYAWSSGIVGNLSGGSVSPTTNTTYTVTVTNSNTCTATGTISVTVNALPTVAPTATPTAICNGGSTTLAANAVAGSGVISTYAWSSGIVGNLLGGSVSPIANATYTVTVTNSNTCTATGTVSVTVTALPTVAPTATPAAICNGGSATLAANAVAGSGVISTYAWSSGIVGNLSGGSVSPTTNTTYTVTVTNSNSCTATGTVSVTVNALPTVAPTATPAAICNGGSTTLAANAVAGSGAISTYAWSSGIVGNLSGGSVSPTTNTTYTVTVTNSNTCTATGTVSVTVNSNPTVAPTATPAAICNGQSTTLAANAIAGSGVISTYAWSSGIVGNLSGGSVSPTTNTTYTVTVTNSNTCTATASVAVTVNPLPSPTANNTGPYCATSTIQLNAGGGTLYSWSGPSAFVSASQNPTRANATIAMTGTYTVTVTDANGCSATATTTVVVNSSLSPVASNTGPYCAGGTVQLNVVGGNTFLWSGPSAFASASQNPSINNATVLMSGTYSVTATDANGCSGTASTTVAVNSLPIPSASNTGPYCAGITIQLNSSGGNSYSWSGPNTYSNATQNPTTPNSTTAMSGTYSVTVTDANSCTATASTNVVVNALPVVNAGGDVVITCSVLQPSLSAVPIGLGQTYSWSGPGIVNGGNTAAPIVNTNGTYTLLLTDANTCTATDNVIVTSNLTPPNANAGPDATLTCAITSVTLTASSTTAGVSFAWSNGVNVATNSVSVANTYTVTVTDPVNGCTASDNAVVSSNTTAPNANAGPDATLTCAITSVTLTASSTTGGVSFAWSNGINIASNPVSVVNTYTVTVTDLGNGCTASDGADVLSNTISPNANAGADQTLSCSVTSILLSGSSTTVGVNYSWSGAGIVSGGNTATPTVNVTGTYTLLVTDPTNGCTANDAADVLPDVNAPNANAGPDSVLTCSITQIGLAGSSTTAGVTYTWTGPGIVNGGNTSAPMVNVSGTYTLTVTDPSNGCSMSDQADVTLDNISPNVNAGADQTLTCAVLSVPLNGSSSTPGATFSWSGAGILSGGNTSTPTVNVTGTYTLIVTDLGNGCTASDVADVISNTTAPNANAGPDATLTCIITSVTLTASSTTSGVSFAWSNGINTANNLVSVVNTYTVTVTDLGNGCTASDAADVISNITAPNANAGPDATLTCAVTSVTLSASSTTAGVSFVWSNGINTAVNSVSVPNTYTVTVTDAANGCTASDNADVLLNTTPPNANAGTDAILTCTITSVTLTASSTTAGVSFAWSNGINNPNNSVSVVNSYSVTVTDPSNGCTASDNAIVSSNIMAPNANAGPDKVLTCTITSATLIASSTTAGVSFAWSTGDNTASTIVAVVNTYTVTVTDAANGCTASDAADVSQNITPPNANAGSDKIISCTMNGIILDGSSATLNATFNWSGLGIVSGANTAVPFINLVGTYTAVVTDPLNGCTASDAVDVIDPNAIVLTADVVDNPCAQLSIGNIDLHVSGGFTPYNYVWSNAAITQDISNLHGGTYAVTVTDNNGCTVSDSYLLNEGFFTVDAQQNATINLGETVQLTGTTNGGTGQETYVWSPDNHLTCAECPSPVASPYTDIVYVLQVTDITGCTDYDTVTIHVIPLHDIFIPNAFTPNGDGNNDFFSIYCKLNLLEFFEVRIFNRWGEKVFESNNANFTWDGTFKGVMQNPQVFVYTIKTTFMDGYMRNDFKGSLTLIK